MDSGAQETLHDLWVAQETSQWSWNNLKLVKQSTLI